MKEIRDRIVSVKNTQKITSAMKLVAAAKVRRAQEAVINGRPFSEKLVQVNLLDVNPDISPTTIGRNGGAFGSTISRCLVTGLRRFWLDSAAVLWWAGLGICDFMVPVQGLLGNPQSGPALPAVGRWLLPGISSMHIDSRSILPSHGPGRSF